MGIRAETKVVGQARRPLPWPTERAALINRHTQSVQAMEARRRQDAAQAREWGRDEGRREMLKAGMEDADFRKYLFRSIADRMGRDVGDRMDEWFRGEIDPVMETRKRFTDMMLARIQMEPSLRENPISAEKAVVMRVSLPPMDFHMAQPFGA